MRNTYIIIIALIVLGVGAALILGAGRKAEAPEVKTSAVEEKPESEAAPNVTVGTVKEFTVAGKNFAFTPSTLTVQKGDRVKITFKNENGFHDFVIDEYGIATKQTQSPTTEVLEFTASKAGSFEYYCSVGTHRAMGMKGTLVVK